MFSSFCKLLSVLLLAMDFLKPLLSLFRTPPAPPRPVALQYSVLKMLPMEIVLHVASFLPLESAASFTICCSLIYLMIGDQYLKALRESGQWERYQLMTLVERDRSNYSACYECARFHRIDKAHRFIQNFPRILDGHQPCSRVDRGTRFVDYYLHERFSSAIFKMTMKTYRHGLDCSKLLELLSLKAKTTCRQYYIEQNTALARIVAGSLLMRRQTILMIPPSQLIPMPFEMNVQICPHVGRVSTEQFTWSTDILKIPHWSQSNVKRLSRLTSMYCVRCPHCLTVFRMDLKRFGDKGSAIFVTSWKDLGTGESIQDAKYLTHVGPAVYPLDSRNDQLEYDTRYLPNEFEWKGKKWGRQFKFDSLLTPEDEKQLFRRNIFGVMDGLELAKSDLASTRPELIPNNVRTILG